MCWFGAQFNFQLLRYIHTLFEGSCYGILKEDLEGIPILKIHPFQTGCASYSYSIYSQPLQHTEGGSRGYPYIKDLSLHPFQTGCAPYSHSSYSQPLQHHEGGSRGYPYIKDLSLHPFETGCAPYSYLYFACKRGYIFPVQF